MYKIREHCLRQSRVTAVFEDRALSFILANGATLEDLSDRLANLDRRHNDRPVAITVKFGSSPRKAGSARRRRAGHSGRRLGTWSRRLSEEMPVDVSEQSQLCAATSRI